MDAPDNCRGEAAMSDAADAVLGDPPHGPEHRAGLAAIVLNPIDINVISATVLVAAISIVVANLLVDIFYSFLDPRVSVA